MLLISDLTEAIIISAITWVVIGAGWGFIRYRRLAPGFRVAEQSREL